MSQAPINMAAERNKVHIVPILENLVPRGGKILEVASGTGQHAYLFCQRNQGKTWQATDLSEEQLSAISYWREVLQSEAFLPPKIMDILDEGTWIKGDVDLIVNINMIHISPWQCTEALFRYSHQSLKKGGYLYLYGPYFERGLTPGTGNLEFDEWLRSKNPLWGLRYLDEVQSEAEKHGLKLMERIEMPANNLSLIFGHQ